MEDLDARTHGRQRLEQSRIKQEGAISCKDRNRAGDSAEMRDC